MLYSTYIQSMLQLSSPILLPIGVLPFGHSQMILKRPHCRP